MSRRFWTVPELWPGGTVVCIGGGPSLTQEQVDYCLGRARVIAINDAYLLAPWADVLYFADGPRKWYGWHRDRPEFQAFTGQRVTIDHPFPADDDPRNRILRNDGDNGLCEKRDGLRTGRNGGYQAINLACHYIGWRGQIVLLGYDMKAGVKGQTNWHDNHQQPTDPRAPGGTWLPKFKGMAAALEGHDIEIINASPGSALHCFPRKGLEEVL